MSGAVEQRSSLLQHSTGAVNRLLRLAQPISRFGLLLLTVSPFALPFLWMALTALKPASQVYQSPPRWLPSPWTLDNFVLGWRLLDFPAFFKNSTFIAVLSISGSLLSSSLVGFAFARFAARGRSFWFTLTLCSVMLPSSVTIIPLFLGFSALGLTNSLLPLVLPAFFGSPFFIFLFRQFFHSLPDELFESAEMDGCTPIAAYWYIALPLSRPVLAAVGILAFVASWNDYLNPLVYLNTPDRFTLPLGLALFQGVYYTQIHYLIPMALLAILPVLAVFILAQSQLIPTLTGSNLN